MDSLKIPIPGKVVANLADDEAFSARPDSSFKIETTYEISVATQGEASPSATS
ncbi:hypothetical protein GCM10023187_07760 [Nibrella viscosa]|uniref:Uncharacterized protein n=1 Tax=Nibrella viscosa TaxID=1084524 RepID=A0ABP8JY18_9BACT